MIIKAIEMDITKIGNLVDCIVNAANESLLGGGGVDGAIHRAAGPRLLEECRSLGGCKPGEAKATRAYNLPQKYIIHTVGPMYHDCKNAAEVLRNCYLNALRLADELGCEHIAFPSIATGIFGYPLKEAAEICVQTVGGFKGKHLQSAYMCILPGDTKAMEAYSHAFDGYFFLKMREPVFDHQTFIQIVDETRSFDFAARPFYLMYLSGEITSRQLADRLSFFGLGGALDGLPEEGIKAIVRSMDNEIEERLPRSEQSFPLTTLWDFWDSQFAFPDGCFAPERMPQDIAAFYFGKPPFYIRMNG